MAGLCLVVSGQGFAPQLLLCWWGPRVLQGPFGQWSIRIYPWGVCVCYYNRPPGFRTLFCSQSPAHPFVGFGTRGHGAPLSSQRLAHWVRGGIAAAYEARNCPPSAVIRAHSTRGVSTSVALCRGVTIGDICQAASWSSVSTFVRSYLLDMCTNSVARSVLGGDRGLIA